MIKITVNKAKCAIEMQAEPKEAVAEAIMATIHLTKLIAQNMGMSYEAATMFLTQQGVLAYKEAMDSTDGDTNG